jgi:hypothetical protein
MKALNTTDTRQDAEWAKRENENTAYMGLIGAGGYGEIHQVLSVL